MKYIYFLGMIFLMACSTQKLPSVDEVAAAKTEIRQVMSEQEKAWSAGDLETFMQGYWKDERLTFTGINGIKYGWNKVLSDYKQGYPTQAAMGKLTFEVKELNALSSDVYHMIGTYTLKLEASQPSGYFTLIWKKIDGKWLIISDHTG